MPPTWVCRPACRRPIELCRVLVLEANHDEQMLQDGPYPWSLKQRIRSRHGHLSNVEAGRLLEDIRWPGLEALFLAHLSEENIALTWRRHFLPEPLNRRVFPQIIIGRQHEASLCFTSEEAGGGSFGTLGEGCPRINGIS